jgi:hypothetical protein
MTPTTVGMRRPRESTPRRHNSYSRLRTPAEEGLTADELAVQAEILASPEIEELKAAIASDEIDSHSTTSPCRR